MQHAYHTNLITDQEILRGWFKWLNEETCPEFREYALEAFRDEMSCPYNPKQDTQLEKYLYYAVYEEDKALLLIRATVFGFGNKSSICISFSRIFKRDTNDKKPNAHLWIINALNQKIINLCYSENIDLILAKCNEKSKKVFCNLRDLHLRGPISRVKDIKISNGYWTNVCIELG